MRRPGSGESAGLFSGERPARGGSGAGMLPPAVVQRLSATFKALGDPTRIRILEALSREELCVCALAGALGMSSSAVSHQLRVLREARLVKFRREGKTVYYSLDDLHVWTLFEQGLKHVVHTAAGWGSELLR